MARIEVLRKALKGINEGYYLFLCNAIFHISGKEATKLFPELLQFKPEDKKLHRAWWNPDNEGKQERIKVLNKLIKIVEADET